MKLALFGHQRHASTIKRLVQSIKSQMAIKAGRDAKKPASAVATGKASMPTPMHVAAIKRVDPSK
jgi:hypothetical protein